MADTGPNDHPSYDSPYGLAVAFLLGAVAMLVIVSKSAFLPGVDSYYHLKMARLLPQIGFIHEFPWLHWTIFREHFVSHHYGFHMVLAPLAWLSDHLTGDLVAGGKAAVVMAMGASAAAFYAALRTLRVPQPLLWTCLLGCLPWHFWLRMAYVRAPIVALPLLLLALTAQVKERPALLCLVAFLFAGVYLGVVVAVLIPLCFAIAHILLRDATKRTWLLLVTLVLGLAAGIVVSPYFPENLPFLKIQIFATGLGAEKDVPSEWRSFDAWTLATMSAPLGVIWGGALILRLRRGVPLNGTSMGLLLLNVAFLVLTLKARRFIEYWPVFALLNAADMARLSAADVSEFLSGGRSWTPRIRILAPIAAALLAIPALTTVRAHARPGTDHAALRPAMTYLAGHSPEGSLVFTDDWDVFPACFYYNVHNRYGVGLDPMFTMDPYPELWERYRLITRGRTPAELGPPFNVLGKKPVALEDIGDLFLARYVLVTDKNSKFYQQLLESGERFRLIYPDGAHVVKGVQPSVSLFEVVPRDQN